MKDFEPKVTDPQGVHTTPWHLEYCRVLGSLASLAFVQQIRGLDPGRGAVSQSCHQLNVSIHLKLIFSFKITRRILHCKAVVKLPVNQREIPKFTFVRRQSDMAGNM